MMIHEWRLLKWAVGVGLVLLYWVLQFAIYPWESGHVSHHVPPARTARVPVTPSKVKWRARYTAPPWTCHDPCQVTVFEDNSTTAASPAGGRDVILAPPLTTLQPLGLLCFEKPQVVKVRNGTTSGVLVHLGQDAVGLFTADCITPLGPIAFNISVVPVNDPPYSDHPPPPVVAGDDRRGEVIVFPSLRAGPPTATDEDGQSLFSPLPCHITAPSGLVDEARIEVTAMQGTVTAPAQGVLKYTLSTGYPHAGQVLLDCVLQDTEGGNLNLPTVVIDVPAPRPAVECYGGVQGNGSCHCLSIFTGHRCENRTGLVDPLLAKVVDIPVNTSASGFYHLHPPDPSDSAPCKHTFVTEFRHVTGMSPQRARSRVKHATTSLLVGKEGRRRGLGGDKPLRHLWKVVQQVLPGVCDPGAAIVDVGANVGEDLSVWVGVVKERGCKPTGAVPPVVALEPHPGNLAVLRSKAEKLSPYVRVVEAGAGDTNRIVPFFFSNTQDRGGGKGNERGSLLSANLAGVQQEVVHIPVVRLDDILRGLGVTTIPLLKVDAEGGDPIVLAGADWALNHTHLVVFECQRLWNATGIGFGQVAMTLAARDFEVFRLASPYWIRVTPPAFWDPVYGVLTTWANCVGIRKGSPLLPFFPLPEGCELDA